jgi:hypothetical protein
VGTNLVREWRGSRIMDQGDRYRFLRWWEAMNGGERVMNGKKGSKKGVINVYA